MENRHRRKVVYAAAVLGVAAALLVLPTLLAGPYGWGRWPTPVWRGAGPQHGAWHGGENHHGGWGHHCYCHMEHWFERHGNATDGWEMGECAEHMQG